MHVEHLKKGDIVLNHLQTKQLIQSGKAMGRGKAYAAGTMFNGMPAHNDSTDSGGGFDTGGSGDGGTGQAIKQLGTAAGDTTKAMDGATNATNKETKAKEKSFQSYDWVERRLKYFADNVQKIADQITDYFDILNDTFKESMLRKELNALSHEISANIKGFERYREKAETIVIDTEDPKNDERLKKLVQQGDVASIQTAFEDWNTTPTSENGDSASETNKYAKKDEMGRTMSDRLSLYQDYWDKYIDAQNNAVARSNDMVDVYEQLLQLPLDKAAEKVEKFSNSIDNISTSLDLATASSDEVLMMAKAMINSPVAKKGKGNREREIINSASKDVAKNPRARLDVAAYLRNLEVSQQRNIVKANRTAVRDTTDNAKSRTTALKRAQKRIQNAGLSPKQEKRLSKRLENNAKLPKRLRKGFNKEDEANAVAYNKAVDESRTAKRTIKKTTKKLSGKISKKNQKALDAGKTLNLKDKNLQNDPKLMKNAQRYNQAIIDKQTTSKTLATAKQTLVGGGYSAKMTKSVKAGKAIDTKGLSGKALKDALAYNRALQQNKIAQDKVTEAVNNTKQSEAELAKMRVANAEANFRDLENYYNAIKSYNQSRTDKRNSALEVKNFATDYLTKEEYNSQVAGNNTTLNTDRQAVVDLRGRLAQEVKAGNIKVGSDKYKEMMTTINELETGINNTRKSQLQLFQDWANAPLEKAAQAVGKLTDRLQAMSAVGAAFKSGGSAVKAFLKNVTETDLSKNARAVANKYKGQPSYVGANAALDKELENKRTQVKRNKEARETAKQNLAATKKKNEAAKTQAKNEKSNLEKALKTSVKSKGKNKISSKQKQILDKAIKEGYAKGEKIDLDNAGLNITDENVLNAIEAYNAALDNRTDAASKQVLANKALEESDKTLLESEEDLANSTVQFEIDKFNNIKDVEELNRETTKIQHSNKEKKFDKRKAHGDYELLSEYDTRIANRQEERAELQAERDKLQEQLNQSVKDGIIEKGSDEWKRLNNEILEMNGELLDADVEIENLKQSKIDLYLEATFERAAKRADRFIDRLQQIVDLVNDDMMYTKEGFFTQWGALRFQEVNEQMQQNMGNLRKYLDERAEIIRRHNDKEEGFGDEAYVEKMEANQEKINQYLSAANGNRQELLNIIVSQSRAELDAINKNVDAYKEVLSRKKAYYDYDKQIKDKNKNIQSLEKELTALQGVAGMEAAAQRARVKAELEKAMEDLEETEKDHIYELQTQGLDDMMNNLNENFEDWSRELAQNLDTGSKAIEEAVINTGAKTNNALDALLRVFGTSLNEANNVVYTVDPNQRAKGGKIKKPELALTNEPEYGREIIVTKNGVLTQLKPGDGVLSNGLTENFFEAARNYPTMEQALNNLMVGSVGSVSATPQVIQPNINCPITINGSNMSAAEIQNVLNSFIPKISQTVQNDIRKDLRKNGR